MNNSKKISVIVTIYNVEPFIRKCIDSVLTQTHTNLELILVNDGSPDNSLAICQEYAKKDKRVVIVDKKNGGQASARNAGIDVATGDYVGFIDGDDWIEPNMYEVLTEKAISTDSDIVQCEWYIVEMTGEKAPEVNEEFEYSFTNLEALKELTVGTGKRLNTSVCCKLFKRSVIGDIRFPILRAVEDDDFVYHTVAASKKVTIFSTPLYDYLNRGNSISHQSFHVRYMALLPVQEHICELLKDRLPDYYNIAHRALCSKQFYIMFQLNKHKKEIDNAEQLFDGVYKQLMASYDDYLKNPVIRINRYMLYCAKYTPKWFWLKVLKIRFKGSN